MGWARFDDGWHDHPKTIAAGLDGAGLFAMCVTWANRNRRSPHPGVIPDEVIARFAGTKAKRLAKLLHQVGSFDDHTENGWPIHGFLDYLPKYDPEKQRENGRKGGQSKRTTSEVLPEPLSEHEPDQQADTQQTAERTEARARLRAGTPSRPVPSHSSGSFSSRPPSSDAHEKSDDDETLLDLEPIAQAVHSDLTHAARVAGEILNGHTVTRPTAYVLEAIRRDPDRYRPAPRPPGLHDLCDHGRDHRYCPFCAQEARAS